jgi:hypothetical protein
MNQIEGISYMVVENAKKEIFNAFDEKVEETIEHLKHV